MPVIKCSNGKWRIGTGPCMYHSKEKAERAYAAYRAKSHSEGKEMTTAKNMIKLLEQDEPQANPDEQNGNINLVNGVIKDLSNWQYYDMSNVNPTPDGSGISFSFMDVGYTLNIKREQSGVTSLEPDAMSNTQEADFIKNDISKKKFSEPDEEKLADLIASAIKNTLEDTIRKFVEV